MYRVILFTLAVSLVSVSAVSADIPLPKNLKYVDPRVRFDGIDKYEDYVFYLRFLTFTGGPAGVPHRLMEVKDTKAFNLKAERRLGNMSLLAIERKDFDKRSKEDPSLKWLTDKTEGVLAATFNSPSTTGSVNDKEVPVTAYRAAIKDGKLTVELVKAEKRGDAGPAGLMPMWLLAIVGSLSLACLGIWFVRRRSPGVH